jgi:mannosylglycerate hydrolase
MMTRYTKTNQLIQNLLDSLCPQPLIDADSFTVFYPCTEAGSEPIEIQILRSHDSPFSILNHHDKEVRFQILSAANDTQLIRSDSSFPQTRPVIRYRILFEPDAVFSFGFHSFKIQPKDEWPTYDSGIRNGRDFLENEWLRMDVRQNGSLVITDKITKQSCPKMHVFEESGDAGDTYNFQPPAHDRIVKSTSFKPRISAVESGPLRGAIRIRIRMKVPSECTANRKSRSTGQGMISIWATVRLASKSRLVTFETVVDNGVKDHRLRVLFPTGCNTSNTYAQIPFHVTERKHEHPTIRTAKELPVGTCPMTGSVTVQDAQSAVSLFTQGLYEYELKQDNARTLALTLLRGVGWLSRDDLALRPCGHAGPPLETRDAQVPGRHVFEYGLYLHVNSIEENWSDVYKTGDRFTLPVFVQTASVPTQESIITIQPDAMRLTALKPAEDGEGVILRLLNASSSNASGQIQFHIPVASVLKCHLDESEIMPLDLINKTVQFSANPWELLTFRILPI